MPTQNTIYPKEHFMSFKNEDEIKTFPAKKKLREYITTRPMLQEILSSSS